MNSELRVCSKCNESKPLTEYYIDKRWGIPLARCKRCQNKACVARGSVPVPITAERVRLFWSKVAMGDLFSCWEWQGNTIKGGYGTSNKIADEQLSHRIAWMLTNGPIPKDTQLLHSCDNPPCCNPAHLFPGTHQDNMDDMVAKGRSCAGERHNSRTRPETVPRGSKSGRAVLTESDIPIIRDLLHQKVSHRAIARQYGVDPTTIRAVAQGKSWSHIP